MLVNCRNLQWDEVEELVLALSDSFAPQGRALLAEWLWEIVIADRVVTPEETAFVAAEATMPAIHKSTQDSIAVGYSEARGIMADAPRAAQIQQPAALQSPPTASDPARHP